jgi:hypothetical protein
LQSLAKVFAGGLHNKGIRVIAWDVDQTVLDTHTGGRLPDDPKRNEAFFHTHMSRHFVALFLAACELKMENTFVTFGDNKDNVPRKTVAGERLVGRMLGVFTSAVSPRTVAFHPKNNTPRLSLCNGKNAHLELLGLVPTASVLIDDDPQNIRAAQKSGYHTIQVVGQGGFTME